MKLKTILLTIGLLASLFGCDQHKKGASEEIVPKEEFAVVEATLEDGRPAIGSFNLSYKNYEYKSKYPWCLKLGIALNLENCKANGLPEAEEINVANNFEDELLENIKAITTSHYIGHLFNDSFLDIYVFLDDPEKVHQWLQTQINKEGLIRGFGYEINEDPKWTTIEQFMN